MSKRSKTAVYPLDEGFMVRGTTDPSEALRLAIESGEVCEFEDDLEVLTPEHFETPGFIQEDRDNFTANAAHRFAQLLDPRNHRVGWLRISPCPPSWCGEHAWHWQHTSGPGRGNFEGVVFDE